MVNFLIELTTDQEAQAWKKAEERAKFFSERVEVIRNKKTVKNEGESRTADEFITACRQDILDQLADDYEKELAQVERDAMVMNVNKKAKKTGKYLELLSVAERDNLNHGKAWFMTGAKCDELSISPRFEGEMVCYVYPFD